MKKFVTLGVAILLIIGGVYFYNKNKIEAPNSPVEEEVGGGDAIPIEAVLVYAGVLPCASCPGIETSLILTDRGDGQGGAFSLTELRQGKMSGTTESTGQWEIEAREVAEDTEAQVYVLTSEENADFGTRYYEVVSEDTIRLLDDTGKRIEPGLPYELKLQ